MILKFILIMVLLFTAIFLIKERNNLRDKRYASLDDTIEFGNVFATIAYTMISRDREIIASNASLPAAAKRDPRVWSRSKSAYQRAEDDRPFCVSPS